MITFEKACVIALEYYKQNRGIDSLAKALDGDDFWYFIGGKPGAMRVGGTVISVRKSDGSVGVVDLPSKENFALLRKATPIELV